MNVNWAAETLSGSVADAIEYCSKILKLRPFFSSEGTVRFIRMFDQLFDILNSRNPLAKGTKAPLRASNMEFWGPFLEQAEQYILGLQDQNGTPVVESERRPPFIGFPACISNVRGIFNSFVASQNAPLKYLLTHKMSQDHLELFFRAVQACVRAKDNPTAEELTAAVERLLVRHDVGASGSKCSPLDGTRVLYALPHDPTAAQTGRPSTTLSDITVAGRHGLATVCEHAQDMEDAA